MLPAKQLLQQQRMYRQVQVEGRVHEFSQQKAHSTAGQGSGARFKSAQSIKPTAKALKLSRTLHGVRELLYRELLVSDQLKTRCNRA